MLSILKKYLVIFGVECQIRFAKWAKKLFRGDETRMNGTLFRQNSTCFAKQKTYGIPFRVIPRNRKYTGILLRIIPRLEYSRSLEIYYRVQENIVSCSTDNSDPQHELYTLRYWRCLFAFPSQYKPCRPIAISSHLSWARHRSGSVI